jgi:hypothetical protein
MDVRGCNILGQKPIPLSINQQISLIFRLTINTLLNIFKIFKSVASKTEHQIYLLINKQCATGCYNITYPIVTLFIRISHRHKRD